VGGHGLSHGGCAIGWLTVHLQDPPDAPDRKPDQGVQLLGAAPPAQAHQHVTATGLDGGQCVVGFGTHGLRLAVELGERRVATGDDPCCGGLDGDVLREQLVLAEPGRGQLGVEMVAGGGQTRQRARVRCAAT
jgi:hypothetical protein